MDQWIHLDKDSRHMALEKEKARRLKKSNWWKNLIAKGVCHYCQKKFSPADLTMDHLVALSRGGKSTKSNIVAACRACNAQKKHLTPVDMILNQLKKKR